MLAPAASAAAPTPQAAAPAPSADLVARWYQDFLDRTPYQTGIDAGRLYWARQIDAGTAPAEVLGAITRSGEFATTAVRDVYVDDLGRLPDPGARCWS